LLNTVKAIEWRDRLKAVAAAAVLDRHDIRAAVAEVERWIGRQARSPTSGRQAAEDGREPNLGRRPRRPTFPQATSQNRYRYNNKVSPSRHTDTTGIVYRACNS